MTTPRTPNSPASPGLTPDDCYIYDEECEFGIQSAERPRATATQLFAEEMGVRFQDVSCRVNYMRIYSRQESYEHHALYDDEDTWIDKHDPPLHLNSDLKWVTPDGVLVEEPSSLGVAPDDWEPSDYDPVWEFCHKGHPDAIKVWRLDLKPTNSRK